jgi:hypothetical protein
MQISEKQFHPRYFVSHVLYEVHMVRATERLFDDQHIKPGPWV